MAIHLTHNARLRAAHRNFSVYDLAFLVDCGKQIHYGAKFHISVRAIDLPEGLSTDNSLLEWSAWQKKAESSRPNRQNEDGSS